MPRNQRQLVLTFDAFGTLFTPREPIGQSYASTARRHGLSGFTDEQIASSFQDAFKREQNKDPIMASKSGWGPLSGGPMYDLPRWWLPCFQLRVTFISTFCRFPLHRYINIHTS